MLGVFLLLVYRDFRTSRRGTPGPIFLCDVVLGMVALSLQGAHLTAPLENYSITRNGEDFDEIKDKQIVLSSRKYARGLDLVGGDISGVFVRR